MIMISSLSSLISTNRIRLLKRQMMHLNSERPIKSSLISLL